VSANWALLIREVAGTREVRVTAWVSGRTTYLHRVIMNCPENLVVDHINGDCLDNRKENLRICTQAENTRNRRTNKGKDFKGISQRPNGNWRARISHEGVVTNIGDFSSKEEAAAAYNRFALLLHASFAKINGGL
jgi:hypothetical protein